MVMDLARFIVFILQSIQILNHYVVHLKLVCHISKMLAKVITTYTVGWKKKNFYTSLVGIQIDKLILDRNLVISNKTI